MGFWQCSGLSVPRNGRFYPGTPRSWSAWGPWPPARAQRALSPAGGTQGSAVKARSVCTHPLRAGWVLAAAMCVQAVLWVCSAPWHWGRGWQSCRAWAGCPPAPSRSHAAVSSSAGRSGQPCRGGAAVCFCLPNPLLTKPGKQKQILISALYILVNSNFYHRLSTRSRL